MHTFLLAPYIDGLPAFVKLRLSWAVGMLACSRVKPIKETAHQKRHNLLAT